MLSDADALAEDGRVLDAIALLTAGNRDHRDARFERRLVALRHAAFPLGDQVEASDPLIDASKTGPIDATDGLFVVEPEQLTVETLRTGIARHGHVLVRGLLPSDDVARLVDGIDRAFTARDEKLAGAPVSETTPWFDPFTPRSPYEVGVKRRWVHEAGGVLIGDSPRMLFELLDTFERLGVLRLVAGYLAERPVLSMNKCTLRRVPLDTKYDWHQDGAFLGQGIRTLDVWVTLTACGRDAPGLDVVPRRLDGLVETGTEGAIFPWAVSPAVVEAVSTETPVQRPVFDAGDALLFDDLFLHRTACDPAMTLERHAIESWFFAPSTYPDQQIPLVV